MLYLILATVYFLFAYADCPWVRPCQLKARVKFFGFALKALIGLAYLVCHVVSGIV